jgi:polyisoprenoid-binding protein YceI
MASESRALTRPFNEVTVPEAGTFTLDPPHTFAYFAVQHLVVGRVRGRFNAVSGTITIADDPQSSTVVVQIETASISTQNETQDEDLRSARYLDVAAFPCMTYRGTGVTPQLGGGWTVTGELTVRDVTRPVALEGVFIGAIVDPSQHVRLAFQANAAFSRKEFGLSAELERESGGFLLGRDISVEIHAEAIRTDGERP